MRLNGIILPHRKGTENAETVAVPCPETVKIAMSQHMGAPCLPLVKTGDKVEVGQKLGDCETYMSCPVHSSVSGTVTAVSDMLLANGKSCKAVEIACDGLQTISKEVTPPEVTDKASLVKAVRESGCCGLGGAGFPTHVKLDYDESKTKIDSLIINAAECEPYITSDYREMIENADGVINGIKKIKKLLGIESVYIGIESNKPKAIALFEEKLAGEDGYKVLRLKASYPQGAEKVIAFNATGRIITEGTLPSDHGILVMNVSTVGFINSYLETGMPLVERRLTIDGDAVKTPCNVRAPIGMKLSDILKLTDTNIEGIHKLISGGPMMGMCVYDTDTPVCKTNNAFLAFKKPVSLKGLTVESGQTNCIRCGRCIGACPVGLMPAELERAYDRGDRAALNKLKINLCMNCGSCSYVCPAKRDLAEKNQLAKGFAISK
ncbi:electron transport complex subunit RsxC [Ruminococcus sp. Marseille-P6503]|uniref:electron transport complex subunit RsxC n=1 Tax=Ruminococcus sp. Marseille-P6503 TaxID=2364796 RepID=UPI000F53ED9E|nr:electron transport complex subunit RsxC [Ruminococcus sp. Marseille-P6503]